MLDWAAASGIECSESAQERKMELHIRAAPAA